MRLTVFQIEGNLHAVGDARLLQIALENLLGNGVKFSAKVDAPVVEFGWDATENAWFVRDNGAGFDMSYAGRLFNAFNRLHGDKDFKGSGIGLATVARVIHRHHGRYLGRQPRRSWRHLLVYVRITAMTDGMKLILLVEDDPESRAPHHSRAQEIKSRQRGTRCPGR